MNCLGPEGPGNTIGKVYYLGAMMCGPVAPGGKLGSQQNPPLQSITKELGPFEKIWDSLKIESIQDAVALSQQAYALSNVDWSNPGAALGALSGMAGRAGLGDLQSAFRIGQTAIKTDWSDPVAALKGAASIGGDTLSLGQSLYDMLPAAAPSPPASVSAAGG